MTKFIQTLLFFSLAASCFAQTPRIDDISVDEEKGELILRGLFTNSMQAIVTVDSISMQIALASDTLIRATIPVTGRGSAGWVKALINGKESNGKLITYFHFEVISTNRHLYSDGTFESEITDNLLHVRGDIIDYENKGLHSLIPTKLSTYHIIANGGNGIHGGQYRGSHYDSVVIFNRGITYDATNYQFNFDYWIPNNYDTTQILTSAAAGLDKNFEIIFYHHQAASGTSIDCDDTERLGVEFACQTIKPLASTDFPPSIDDVRQPSISNILKATLSADPIINNSNIFILLRDNMNIQIEIIDILGNNRFSEERMLSAGENRLPVNTSTLPTGVYICRLQAGKEVVSLRFMKE